MAPATTHQAGTNSRWVAALALQALAAQGLAQGGRFTSSQLLAWAPGLRDGRRCANATGKLIALGYLTGGMKVTDTAIGQREGVYEITATGAVAIAAAAQGQAHRSGPRGAHGRRRPPAQGAFVARLWTLVRTRRIVDSEGVASTLVDAGGDVTQATQTAARYLRRWAAAGILRESAQRLEGGRKRFVLVSDPGPSVPRKGLEP